MKRYLALGDSYTIGESVAAREAWPALLADELRERGVDLAEPQIIAKTGWTTEELANAITERSPRGPFDLVTLLAGVNDQYRGRLPQEHFAPSFEALLKLSIALAGGSPERVIVLSIPDWSVTPFAADRDRMPIAAAIDEINEVARRKAEGAGAHWIDVTILSRKAADDLGLVAEDGLHPSAAAYREWSELVAPVALAILR